MSNIRRPLQEVNAPKRAVKTGKICIKNPIVLNPKTQTCSSPDFVLQRHNVIML